MTTIIVTHIALTLLCAIHIILYGSRAAKSLSWLLILILLPFIGPLLYIVFGINRRRFKFFPLKETSKRRLYDLNLPSKSTLKSDDERLSDKASRLSSIVKNSSGFPIYPGNKVEILQTGSEAFDYIFDRAKTAKSFIHMEYYIIEEGKILDKFLKLFQNKIDEGVEVRILFDAIGSYSLKSKVIKKFENIGVKVFRTMPLKFGSFLFTLNYRNHRKLLIIDGKIGFTGGVNISDKYIKAQSELGIWDDTHLMVEGPVVDGLHRVFIKDYYFASDGESLLNDTYLPMVDRAGDAMVQIVASGPDSKHPAIMQQYIAMINAAETSIYISNPYFIPNGALLEALRIAALAGVEIKILVPLKSDSWLAKHSMLSFFEELLELGVEIYEQREHFLHSKLILVDKQIASVGSGNFDHRSFEHNFETNALIYDGQISEEMAKEFLEDCKGSKCLDYETYKDRSLTQKFSEGIARFFSPLL